VTSDFATVSSDHGLVVDEAAVGYRGSCADGATERTPT
jgi:hypothetical protein